jgi:hypothetical protein
MEFKKQGYARGVRRIKLAFSKENRDKRLV